MNLDYLMVEDKDVFESEKNELVRYWKWRLQFKNKKIIDAFLNVPREDFVLEFSRPLAYWDNPLRIGHGQTISQPTTVATMLDELELENKKGFKVLEIGAGSGYNAALLGTICSKGRVYSVEIVPELVEFARRNLEKFAISNVEIIQGDGSLGYEKEAPYDRIVVTACAPEIPTPLIGQLKNKGIILMPVGSSKNSYQNMIKGVRNNGQLNEEDLGAYRFVPLVGKDKSVSKK